MGQEKRRIPRLTMASPMEATMAGRGVVLLDLSNGGALVEHEFLMKTGGKTTLEFSHDGQAVSLSCVLVRTKLGRSTAKPGSFAYASGLRFTDPAEPARLVVRQIVASISRGE